MKALILALLSLSVAPASAAQFQRLENASSLHFKKIEKIANDFCEKYSDLEGMGFMACGLQHFEIRSRRASEPLLQSIKQLQYIANSAESADAAEFEGNRSEKLRAPFEGQMEYLFDGLNLNDVDHEELESLRKIGKKAVSQMVSILAETPGLRFFNASAENGFGNGTNITIVDETTGEILIFEATYSE